MPRLPTCLGLLGLALSSAVALPARAETRALVIGINEYANEKHLLGAVNDALDLAAVLTRRGIQDRTLLKDGEATRAGFDAAWNGIMGRSKPGDVILFTFAGHGMRTPERGPIRRTPDGFDKGFLLAPFHPDRAPNEILRDEALYDLFQAATAKGVKVVFLADACHSGAAVRSVDPRRGTNLPTRLARFDTGAGSGASLAPVGTERVVARPQIGGLSVFSATLPTLPVQEVAIEGKPRGAMSYAMARGLEGAADPSGRGHVTAENLQRFVVPIVFAQSNNTQPPQFAVPEPGLTIMPSRGAGGGVSSLPDPTVLPLAVLSGEAGRPNGAIVTADKTQATLLWDGSRGEILNARGEVLASGVDAGRLEGAVGARRVVESLTKAMQAPGVALTTRLHRQGSASGNGADPNFGGGETVVFEADKTDFAFPTILNVAADGTVQFLWPLTDTRDPVQWTAPGPVTFTAPVAAPFGSDTIVVIQTPAALTDLHRSLEALHGRVAPLEAYDAIRRSIASGPFRIGVHATFTCERLEGGSCATGRR